MKTRRISLWAGRQANLIPASFYKNLCGLCGNLFMSICQNTKFHYLSNHHSNSRFVY